jgi:hypothetical protein
MHYKKFISILLTLCLCLQPVTVYAHNETEDSRYTATVQDKQGYYPLFLDTVRLMIKSYYTVDTATKYKNAEQTNLYVECVPKVKKEAFQVHYSLYNLEDTSFDQQIEMDQKRAKKLEKVFDEDFLDTYTVTIESQPEAETIQVNSKIFTCFTTTYKADSKEVYQSVYYQKTSCYLDLDAYSLEINITYTGDQKHLPDTKDLIAVLGGIRIVQLAS